jgi:hypothetical protein
MSSQGPSVRGPIVTAILQMLVSAALLLMVGIRNAYYCVLL